MRPQGTEGTRCPQRQYTGENPSFLMGRFLQRCWLLVGGSSGSHAGVCVWSGEEDTPPPFCLVPWAPSHADSDPSLVERGTSYIITSVGRSLTSLK